MLLYIYLIITSLLTTPVYASSDNIDELINSSVKTKEALVVKVPNSDTLVLENGERIRLIGVESFGLPPRPKIEYDEKGRPIEDQEIHPNISMEEQAIVFARSIMENKKVKLEYDIDARDNRGYKIAYVYTPDGKMANVELLRQGFVRLRIRPPNIKHEAELKKAYQEARKEQRGFLSY